MLLLVCVSAFCFTACGEEDNNANTDTRDQQIVAVYNQYVAYAESNGQTPLSYEEWLASIKGEKGDNGADGISVEEIFIGEDGHLYVKLTGDTEYRDLGLVSTPNPEQEGFSKGLVYEVNSDRTGYKLIGLGTNTDKILKIPETYNGLPVTEILIGNGDELYDNYVEKIIISKNVTTNLDFAFQFTEFMQLKEIEVDEQNQYVKSIDGVLYSKDGKKLLLMPANYNETEFVVPEGVELIEYAAISEKITTITLTKSLSAISGTWQLDGKTVKYPGTIQEYMESELGKYLEDALGMERIECLDGIYDRTQD